MRRFAAPSTASCWRASACEWAWNPQQQPSCEAPHCTHRNDARAFPHKPPPIDCLSLARDRALPDAAKLYDEYHKLGGGEVIDKPIIIDGVRYNGTASMDSVRMLKGILKLLPRETYPSVLEGGPGNCWLLNQLKARGYDTHGQEVSAFAIQKNCGGLDVRQGYLHNLTSYASGSMNLVMAFDVMEHIQLHDLPRSLRELRRVAAPPPHGALVVNVARCAEQCTHGFCADERIHPLGLCTKHPRPWWDRHFRDAGFDPVTPERMKEFEAQILVKPP